MRAAPSSREGRAGATWRRVIVRSDLTAEPPAHCRLVSDHDLFEIVVFVNCTVQSPLVSSFVRPEAVLSSRPYTRAVHGAQRRSRTARSAAEGSSLTAASTVRRSREDGAQRQRNFGRR